MTQSLGELIRLLEGASQGGGPPAGSSGGPDQVPPDQGPGEVAEAAGSDQDDALGEPGEPAAPLKPEAVLPRARSLLTEPHPSHFGEVLLTDVWLAPEPKAAKRRPPGPGGGRGKGGEGQAQAGQSWVDVWLAAQARSPGLGLDDGDETSEPADRQKQWATRQELRQLGLLRERPALSYDARTERYWGEVRRAQRLAAHAIIDPYTDLVAGFADAEPERIPELRVEAREYGRDAQALLALGRAYVAIGRIKSAQGAFRAAAAADPYYPEAWWHLGIAHLFTRANDKGARELEWAAELAPGDSRVEMGAALARYHLRDFAAAEGWFSRLAGSGGLRASARSMLACSVRMQAKWDQARVELGLLRQDRSGDWGALAAQCEDCVARGEERLSQTAMGHRRAIQMWKSLAATGAGGLWVVYSLAEDLFRKELRWALVPLFALALAAGRALKGISTRERAGEFGNAEQGLPCWQATTWVNPRRSEL